MLMGCNLWMIGYLESLLGLALPMHEALLGLASGVRPFSSFLASLAAAERVRSAGELGGRRKGIGACRRESAWVTAGFAPSPPYIWSPLPREVLVLRRRAHQRCLRRRAHQPLSAGFAALLRRQGEVPVLPSPLLSCAVC